MKFNYTTLLIVFLVGTLILISPPFVMSADVGIVIKSFFLFVSTIFLLFSVSRKKRFFYFYFPFVVFLLFQVVYWTAAGYFMEGIFFFLYILLAICGLIGFDRLRGGKEIMIKLYFYLILITSFFSILSFLTYNLGLLPYFLKLVGGDDGYVYYYFPFLGYINVKELESFAIGRVCYYFFEPSYLGFFLTTNFFLLHKLNRHKNVVFISKVVVFFGAMASMSTMSWLVFAAVFGVSVFYRIFETLRISEKVVNFLLIFVFLLFYLFIPKDKLLEKLGPSSSDDREERASMSLLLVAGASPSDFVLGRSPAYIEKTLDKGESNQIIKMLVENGVITTVLVLIFIIYCTRKSKLYMIALILFLNSAVILFTPLIIFNILICRWADKPQISFSDDS
ncbi:hypothetical protein R1T16_08105 [Flavobacterium sp. DG1-102-2]|uniref:hypothetical protein n=1 Tax=Flavobacterium sp. DG1-102-2 TaxID=3081663 RepID=UPI00294A6FC3|nr:hypothetical protein [Flavobacterium sp. DG1-102-2]MDV6168387.1 hypothetical protein [Flavobacterium sp. DG1-102-2]